MLKDRVYDQNMFFVIWSVVVNRMSFDVCTRPRPAAVCLRSTARCPFSGSSPGPGRLRASGRSTWLWCPFPAAGTRTWWPASSGDRSRRPWRCPPARSSRCRFYISWWRRKTCCPSTTSLRAWRTSPCRWPRTPPTPTGKLLTARLPSTSGATAGCTGHCQPCYPCCTGTPMCTAIGSSGPTPDANIGDINGKTIK